MKYGKKYKKNAGEKLYYKTGGLILTNKFITGENHANHFFKNTIEAARKYNIQHKEISVSEAKKRFPAFKLNEYNTCYYEPDAGYLIPEKCIKSQIKLSKRNGAKLHTDEKVLSYRKTHNGLLEVVTDKESYLTNRLVISAGSWINDFLPKKYKNILKIYKQVTYWFDIEGSYELFKPERFPIFVWQLPEKGNGIYGFPAINGSTGGFKIASEQYESHVTPSTINRQVNKAEKELMFNEYVKPYFKGVNIKCLRVQCCMYTVTPDSGFVIDNHPSIPEVILLSPCSGHGFKHSAAIGEIASQMALGKKLTLDISEFKLSRFIEH